MKRTFCEYQRCDKQWDDDEQEEIQVLRCDLFAKEGSWEEYCDCDEQEVKECMLYKYKKLKEELERSQKENEKLKQRSIAGVKVFVSNETYNNYKGTLQEQLEDYKSRCEKAVDEIQQLIDDVNNKTIIGLNNFLLKLEEIQDKLANGDDEE